MLTVRFRIIDCVLPVSSRVCQVMVHWPEVGTQWCSVEMRESVHTTQQVVFRVPKQKDSIALPSSHLSFWWYPVQQEDETRYVSSSLKGFCFVPLHKPFGVVERFPLYHQAGDKRIPWPAKLLVTIDCSSDPFGNLVDHAAYTARHKLLHKPLPALDAFSQATSRWLCANFPAEKQLAVTKDHLTPLLNTDTLMPFPGKAARKFPMWCFTFPTVSQRFDQDDVMLSQTLSRLVSCALFRLGLPRDPDAASLSIPTVLEIACEAACLLSLSLLYRPDKQGTRSDDEWCYLLQCPQLVGQGADCEDLQELTLRVIWQLQRNVAWGSSSALSRRIQSCLQPYHFCNCLVTLKLGGANRTWHSLVMGLDHEWLVTRGISPARQVPLVLESTSWSTSCLEFQSPLPDSFSVDLEEELDASQSFRKASPKRLIQYPSYLHVVCAFTPALVKDHEMAEVFFVSDSGQELGVPMIPVWQGTLQPKLLTATLASRTCLDDIKSYFDWQPFCFPFPKTVSDPLPFDERDRALSSEPRPTTAFLYATFCFSNARDRDRSTRAFARETRSARRRGLKPVLETRVIQWVDGFRSNVSLLIASS